MSNPGAVEIVRPLEKRRLALGYSRERLGAAGGVSSATVRRVERGLVNPHPATQAALAQALGCEVEDIFPVVLSVTVTDQSNDGDAARLLLRFERVRAWLPSLSREEFSALTEVLGLWCQIKARSEPHWTWEQRRCLCKLDADLSHSALLWRMLGERKPPLAVPPPVEHAYPVYP